MGNASSDPKGAVDGKAVEERVGPTPGKMKLFCLSITLKTSATGSGLSERFQADTLVRMSTSFVKLASRYPLPVEPLGDRRSCSQQDAHIL